MLSLEEARQFYTEDELTDEELMTLVKEIDQLQVSVLDSL